MILFAINISNGGGRILLDELLLSERYGKIKTAFLDSRYKIPQKISPMIKIIKVKPTLTSRFIAEIKLWILEKKFTDINILFFGNLPPIFKMQNKTTLYLQNAFLLRSTPILNDSLKLFLRYIYEVITLRTFITNIDEIWVQTNWMVEKVKKDFDTRCRIEVFYPPIDIQPKLCNFDFVLQTGSLKHKNFQLFYNTIMKSDLWNEIKIAIICAGTSKEIDDSIDKLRNKKNLKLEIFSNISHEDALDVLARSKYLMTLSLLESLSLPIYEANELNKNIVCLDLPLNREVVKRGIFIKEPYLENLSMFLEGRNDYTFQ